MSGKLTKAELSKEIAQNCGSSLKEGKQLLELILSAMTRALSRGERVEIRGFGSLATRVRRTRVMRNPKTGAVVKVPAKRVPHFRVSRQLRAVLQRKVC
jgi:integration host factor subunit beta